MELKSILDLFNQVSTLEGAYLIQLLLLIGIGYYLHTREIRKIYSRHRTLRTVLLSKINSILNIAKDSFASDLCNYKASGNEIEDDVFKRIILVQSNLLQSCFYRFTISLESILINNHLPKPGTCYFDSVLEDKFLDAWTTLMTQYKDGYNPSFYRLNLEDRIQKQQEMYTHYLREFKDFFTMVYNTTK